MNLFDKYQPGYYHVTYNGVAEIAKYDGVNWWICDLPFSMKEEEFDEIRGIVIERI